MGEDEKQKAAEPHAEDGSGLGGGARIIPTLGVAQSGIVALALNVIVFYAAVRRQLYMGEDCRYPLEFAPAAWNCRFFQRKGWAGSKIRATKKLISVKNQRATF